MQQNKNKTIFELM